MIAPPSRNEAARRRYIEHPIDYERFLVTISHDDKPYVKQIEFGALIGSMESLAKMIADPGGFSPTDAELAGLAKACTDRLMGRLQQPGCRRKEEAQVTVPAHLLKGLHLEAIGFREEPFDYYFQVTGPEPNGIDLTRRWPRRAWERARPVVSLKMNRPWPPIETAPEDGTIVDLWMVGPRNSGMRRADCWFKNGRWWCDCLDRGDCGPEFYVGDVPTHWMPIPEPPNTP